MKKEVNVAIACFYNPFKNKILLQERWYYSKKWEEWAFFGWWMEIWETHFEAVCREIKEELDLDITEFDYKYIWKFRSEFPDRITYRNVYFIKTNLEETDFTVLEWVWAKYFNINEARTLKFPSPATEFFDFLEKNMENLR